MLIKITQIAGWVVLNENPTGGIICKWSSVTRLHKCYKDSIKKLTEENIKKNVI